MIFVDTGAWFAFSVPSDPNHPVASAWLRSNNSTLLTTDYVVDETLTSLRARGESQRAVEAGEAFFEGSLAVVLKITEDDLLAGWQVFKQFRDKGWSFTDCTSKVIIEKLQIRSAVAFDHHFVQFGSVKVLP